MSRRNDLPVRFVDDAAHLRVDECLGVRRGLGHPRKERACAVTCDHGERTDCGAHPPAADHLAGELRQLLDVGLRADARLAEDDLLGGPAPERDLDLRLYLGRAVVGAIVVGRRKGDAERETARDDRDLA